MGRLVISGRGKQPKLLNAATNLQLIKCSPAARLVSRHWQWTLPVQVAGQVSTWCIVQRSRLGLVSQQYANRVRGLWPTAIALRSMSLAKLPRRRRRRRQQQKELKGVSGMCGTHKISFLAAAPVVVYLCTARIVWPKQTVIALPSRSAGFMVACPLRLLTNESAATLISLEIFGAATQLLPVQHSQYRSCHCPCPWPCRCQRPFCCPSIR